MPLVLHYSRKPALFILLAAVAVCWAFRSAHGHARPEADDPSQWPLSRLEIAVADEHATGQTWFYLGNRLMERQDYAHAADAYRRAMRLSPALGKAHTAYALALAGEGNTADLLACVREMISVDPKEALDLLDRSECRRYLTRPEFASLRQEARLQTMD